MSALLASATVFGKPGELVQVCPGPGSTVLLACAPSRRLASTVRVLRGDGGLEGVPPKARQAVLAFLASHAGRPSLRGLAFRLRSGIPAGKGLGSSSADVLAALSACRQLWGGFSREGLYRLAASVEPTDPLLGGGLFDSRRGIVLQEAALPDHARLWWDADPGRTVDTLADAAGRPVDPDGPALLRRAAWALRRGDLAALSRAATESARRSQARLPRPGFEEAAALARRAGGGVFVGHTGTVMGLLLPPGTDLAPLAAEVARLWGTPPVAERVRR